MNTDKLRFLTVVTFALILLFSMSAQALGPIAPLPPQSIITLQNQVNNLESQVDTACCTNGWYFQSVVLPSEVIPAGTSTVEERLLCPDRNTQIAILGGYQWGPSVGGSEPTNVPVATVTNPPCGGAFWVQLSEKNYDFTRNELYLWVVCVDWPFGTPQGCP